MRRTRTELLRLLEPGLGSEAATALLEEFETVDPDRLATKDDLAATEVAVRRDVSDMRDGLHTEMAEMDNGLREELGHRVDLLRVEMDGRFGRTDAHIATAKEEVLAAVRGEMISAIATQTRTMQYTLAGTMLAVIALAASLATFL